MLLYTSSYHAHVSCSTYNQEAMTVEVCTNCMSNLLRQSLLDLKPFTVSSHYLLDISFPQRLLRLRWQVYYLQQSL